MSSKTVSITELQKTELTDDIKIICPEDPRQWLVFTRDMIRKQVDRYNAQLRPLAEADILAEAKKTIGDYAAIEDASPEDQSAAVDLYNKQLSDEINRIVSENVDARIPAMLGVLREVILDGEFVVGKATFSGTEEIITAAENDDLSIITEQFLLTAIHIAREEMQTLGNARRRS